MEHFLARVYTHFFSRKSPEEIVVYYLFTATIYVLSVLYVLVPDPYATMAGSVNVRWQEAIAASVWSSMTLLGIPVMSYYCSFAYARVHEVLDGLALISGSIHA